MSDQQEQKKTAIERLEDNERAIALLTSEMNTLKQSVLSVIKEFETSVNGNFKQIQDIYANLLYTVQSTSQKVENVSSLATIVSESLAALVGVIEEKKILDTNLVGKKVLEIKSDRRYQTEESLIAQNLLKESDVSGKDSLVVVRQTLPSGEIEILRDHVNMSVLDEKVQKVLLNRKPGDVFDVENGRKIEVLRVLDPVENSSVGEEEPQSSEGVQENA